MREFLILAAVAASLAACRTPSSGEEPAQDQPDAAIEDQAAAADMAADAASEVAPVVRVATFNASLWREAQGELVEELADADAAQPRQVAEVIQRVRPDVLLINEFDWDADGEALARFKANFLEVGQGGQEPIVYEHHLVPATNTGVASGFDLDNDGQVAEQPGSNAYGQDAFGYGRFPGQYGMVILSRHPIDAQAVRTFQTLRWASMPDNVIPPGWFDADELAAARLSSKNHVDVPISVGGRTLHLLASHPTPPAFDGEEGRNKRRNNDEVRLWRDYVEPGRGGYIVDDAGGEGGLAAQASFVIVGDLNVDPVDGLDEYPAIRELLASERVQDPKPASEGARQASERDGGVNASHQGDPALDTADFSDGAVGNRRVDYALPSSDLEVRGAGVFWPAPGEEGEALTETSDHHLTWVDVTWPGGGDE